jgi:hypothetical protein
MEIPRPANRCGQCGSTNYQRLFARDGSGLLRHNGLHQCSGCQLSFSQASQWRAAAGRGDLVGAPDPPGMSMTALPVMVTVVA